MSLGYALLHPRQLDAALMVTAEKRSFNTAFDVFCGALGVQNVDAELEAAFAAQAEAITDFAGRFETLFEPGRPLAQVKLLASFNFSDPQTLTNTFTMLCDFLESTDSDQVKALSIPVIDAVLEVMPNLDIEIAAGFSTKLLDQITGILKAPLRQGRKDVAAVKAYRAAMTLRCLLDPVYLKLKALGQVDIKLALRETLIGLLNGLDQIDFGPLRVAVGGLKGQFGGLFSAIMSCAAGGTVSAGIQTMPDSPLNIGDEIKAAPHTLENGPGLWAADLTTNILNLFNLIWEIVRTRPFVDRGFDGAFMIVGVVWQAVRTVFRAAGQDLINRPISGATDGQKFLNWLFSDWGDTAIHLFLRLLITLFYEAADGPTNWALMLTPRFMMYFANTFNLRIWYQFSRSMWYFGAHKDAEQALDELGDAEGPIVEILRELVGGSDVFDQDGKLNKMPLGRMLMGIIPPIWAFVGIIGGVAMPWEGFVVEDWTWEYAVPAIIALALWVLAHVWVSAASGTTFRNSFHLAGLPDYPLIITLVVIILLMMIALLFVVLGLESSSEAAALTGVIVIPLILIGLLLGVAIRGLPRGTSLTGRDPVLNGFTQALSAFATTVIGLAAAVIWWFTIDDGRDKEEVYEDLDVEKTPYLLPVKGGENWFCGQSYHGVFSHTFTSPSNHYAVDMNEAEGAATTAPRDGIVVQVTQGNPSNESNQNDAVLMHSAWAENADPGTEFERVLTYSNYVHAQERGVHARVGQFVPRGMHLIDIDSTGRSAVHHIHYSGQTAQNEGRREGLPFIFGDQSLRKFRNYPPLSIFPGKGRIDGKPLSFAFYVSDNDEVDSRPHALTLETLPAEIAVNGVPITHIHRIMIEAGHLAGDTIPETLTLNTTVSAGHFHTVTLNRTDLEAIFKMNGPDGVSTSEEFDHSHSVGGPLLYEIAATRTSLGNPNMTTRIVEPPSGKLTALDAGPYDLLGERMVLRVNNRMTEWHFWGGDRVRITADIAMDYGLSAAERIEIDGDVVTLPGGGADRLSLRQTTTEMSLFMRNRNTPPVPAEDPLRRIVARAEPVLVIETRRRGSSAQLDLTGGSLPNSLLPVTTPIVTSSAGTGPFANLNAVSRVEFLAHVTDIVSNGWPNPPQPVAANVNGGLLGLQFGGAAPNFAGSSTRIQQVADLLYDTTTLNLRSPGPMPLGTGRLALDAIYSLPILATPARVTLSTPAEDSVLNIIVNLASAPLDVTVAANSAETAQRIMQSVEGVRAWTEGTDLIVETVSAGSAAALSIGVDGGAADATNGQLPAGLNFTDPIRLNPTELEQVVDDAVARASLPANAGTHNLRVTPDGNRLKIEVDAPATIAATVVATADVDPIGFVTPQATPQEVITQELPANLRFEGPAWIDIEITEGATIDIIRIPIDGEPARLDIALDRLPENGEDITIQVNGNPVVVNFDGSEQTMASVADKISTASSDITARLAYRMALEDMLWGDAGGNLRLLDTGGIADGLALAGFMGARPIASNDRVARGEDMNAQGAALPDNPERQPGILLDIMTLDQIPSGGGTRIDMTATAEPPATELIVTVTPGDDPLGFSAGASPDIQQTNPLQQTTDLGGPVKIYEFRANAADTDIAAGFTQLCAQPAVARTMAPASLPIAGTATLSITITEPAEGGPVVRDISADLSGVESLDEIAQRISAASPQLRAWVVRASEVPNAESTIAAEILLAAAEGRPQTLARSFDERLHIESASGGTGWQLSLGDLQTAAALGFPLTAQIDDALVFSGRGNVADGRAVTRAEIIDALQEAVDSMTGSVNPTGAQDRISVLTDGDTIELRSAEGQLDLEFEPESLGDRLVTEVLPEVTRLNAAPGGGGAPPTDLSLDSGRILIRNNSRGLAAVELFAAPAELRSDVVIPVTLDTAVTEQLDLLKANPIIIRINGAARTLPVVPGAITTLEDAVAFLSQTTNAISGWQGDDWWIGLVEDTEVNSSKRCVIQTIRRGTDANLELDLGAFTTPLPANGILGFTTTNPTATGAGNVQNMDSLPVAAAADSLLALVEEAVERGGARQALYTTTFAGGAPPMLRVTANLSTTTLEQRTAAATAPAGVSLAPPGGMAGAAGTPIEDAFVGGRNIDPGVMTIRSNDGSGPGNTARDIRTLFHAEPARLGPFTMPVDIAVLNDSTLRLSINSTTRSLAVVADAATTPLMLARQLEQSAEWTIRIVLTPGSTSFVIETVRRGFSARLELLTPGLGTNAVTGDTATGFVAPGETDAEGSGSVSNIGVVTGPDYGAALQSGMVAERNRTAPDESVLDELLSVTGSAYDPPERDLTIPVLSVHPLPREYARVQSQRSGCASSVIPVTLRGDAALPMQFNMDRTLERAPAVRASVRIPPFDPLDLSGRLHIQFNENNANLDFPPEQTVVVDIPNGNYTAETLANVIHNQLFDGGIGAAQAYNDGSVMIETMARGILGTIRIPAAATPDADAALAEALIPGGSFCRGWPGAGRGNINNARARGFRSLVGDMAADPNWEFTDGTPSVPAMPPATTPPVRADFSVTYTGTAGDSIEATAAALDRALASAQVNGVGPMQRIGFAAIGDDGALYVEGISGTFDLVGGINDGGAYVTNVEISDPPRVGGTPERAPNPLPGFVARTSHVRYE